MRVEGVGVVLFLIGVALILWGLRFVLNIDGAAWDRLQYNKAKGRFGLSLAPMRFYYRPQTKWGVRARAGVYVLVGLTVVLWGIDEM